MPNTNLSPWFADEQPTHNGLYERKTRWNSVVYAYWFNGWYSFAATPISAFVSAQRGYKSGWQEIKHFPWRGITA